MTYEQAYKHGKLLIGIFGPPGWHVYAVPNPHDQTDTSLEMVWLNHQEELCLSFYGVHACPPEMVSLG